MLSVSIIASLSLKIQAQDTTDSRPKIGLVLSGGGAKGLAHIGVLKVLEEAGIVPDLYNRNQHGKHCRRIILHRLFSS